jgi:hypothetical protein
MLTYETAFARELAKLVSEAIAREMELLAGGWVIQDYASYKQKVGQIEALRAVLSYLEEAESNAKKR